MNDFDQFKQTYISEAFELLEDMEERLLGFDEDNFDMEEVNAIFRCAHSIKGGGGSFGFKRLVDFTHIMEFLLDKIRNEEIQISEEIIDTLLKSVDIVSALVTAAQNEEELPAGYEDELLQKLNVLSEGGAEPKQQSENTAAQSDESNTEEAFGIFDESDNGSGEQNSAEDTEYYKITFIPYRELLEYGNEPLFIIRELMKNSDLTVKVDDSNIPDFEDIDPVNCYLSWEIEVATSKGVEQLLEAFEFVDGECDLKIDKITELTYKSKDSEEETAFGLFGDEAETQEKETAFGLFDDEEGSPSEAPAQQVPAKPQVVAKAPEKTKESDNSQASKKPPAISSIRVDISKVDKMVNMVGEIVITQAMLTQKLKDIPPQYIEKISQGIQELSRHTRDLQEAVMAVRMQPVKTIFSRMPRIVRDISRKLNKLVRIEMKGEATEIDKTVIEQLSDPLTHMIRNSLDHGVEMPDVRTANGKPAEGVINLSADNSGGRIIIEITDDGAGINRERVLQKAIEKGLFPEDVNLSPEEIDQIIFMPGFSTAEKITDVSGRGVGMDVVMRNIKELGGDIDVENRPGQGSTFLITLPLTLAILDGMVIQSGDEKYILPINNILETMQTNISEIKNVKTGEEVITVRGEFIPIIDLADIFGIEAKNKDSEKRLVVLVEAARKRFGLIVDELLGQQQVVIKNLAENSDTVEGVSGATILGDGNVSLILDVAQIHRMKFSNDHIRRAA
jgi:two-component system chemotaxis sensor kinase CheA